ncbi:EamA family transporter RarD [Pseudomonas sp. ABC1]|uniref:EamA family transporter RarD n=1 Tax=Pseudomonas sp. ABC1 TaxID=2748080 RepID=UPI0015C335B5|nr:EamA family transporter RarD [Pseudomonas sp. ABC1]QLF94741.1 EamA family transporter RarD [Pseudomonas sp. ABC1]
MARGVVLSVLASCLFGVLYYYSTLLSPLGGESVFAWRMLLTFPFATLFIVYSGEWKLVSGLFARIRAQPVLLPLLVLSALLLAVQLWLFMWAPLHGRGLQVSLGYFMLPLTMVLAGFLVYREHLSRLQKLAVLCAVVGVGNELWQVGSFAWECLVVALGYPLYFMLRRRLGTDHLGGLWFDMLLMLPAAIYLVASGGAVGQLFSDHPKLYGLVPLLGAISALALISYILASRMLSFGLFGLLGYVEPVLLVMVALLLGETIASHEWLTYVPIWLAVALLVMEGVLHLRARRRQIRVESP